MALWQFIVLGLILLVVLGLLLVVHGNLKHLLERERRR
jgi:uncharacterized iron-regulated membrane protein